MTKSTSHYEDWCYFTTTWNILETRYLFQKKMATRAAHCWKILDTMEERILWTSSSPYSSGDYGLHLMLLLTQYFHHCLIFHLQTSCTHQFTSVTFVIYGLKWTGGYKMSGDGKSNSDGNIVLKEASSEAHSLQMSMKNLRIRDDTEGHNRWYQLGSSNGHVHTPDPRVNNPDVLWGGQLRISENVGAIQDVVYNMGAVPSIEEKTKR